MPQFVTIFMSLALAARAVLGCCCAHAYQSKVDARAHVAIEHAADGHHPDEHQPAHEHSDDGRPCCHVSCNFVKGDTARLDVDKQQVSLIAFVPLMSVSDVVQAVAADSSVCLADRASAGLYVWHCALLI